MTDHHELLKVYCDGGSRGNPGPAASGAVITTKNDDVLATYGKSLGRATNNQAEYRAVVLALDNLVKFSFDFVEFYLDSELVVKQLKGEYRVKNPDLKPIYDSILSQLKNMNYSITHIRREYNKLADKAVNDCLDGLL